MTVTRAMSGPLSLATSAESWITAGGPHHTVLSQAVGTEIFRDFAHMLDVELLVIDDTTTRASIADRIRWNAAYHRLAQGF